MIAVLGTAIFGCLSKIRLLESGEMVFSEYKMTDCLGVRRTEYMYSHFNSSLNYE